MGERSRPTLPDWFSGCGPGRRFGSASAPHVPHGWASAPGSASLPAPGPLRASDRDGWMQRQSSKSGNRVAPMGFLKKHLDRTRILFIPFPFFPDRCNSRSASRRTCLLPPLQKFRP